MQTTKTTTGGVVTYSIVTPFHLHHENLTFEETLGTARFSAMDRKCIKDIWSSNLHYYNGGIQTSGLL